MICPGCCSAASAAAERGRHEHDPNVCYYPNGGCDCAHGHPIEQDPNPAHDAPAYVDALPPDDPRRKAYEAKQGRVIS